LFPKEYIEYLVHFHGDRDYFECHEILEEYWKSVDPRNRKSVWVGFIQIAVANYHFRRGNLNGAYRMLRKAINILKQQSDTVEKLGMDQEKLLELLQNQLTEIKNGTNYNSLTLPITSESLLAHCMARSKELNIHWCSPSDLSNIEIIHRHSRRDRSDVILERNKALNNRL
jgi:uncharacterized protein